MIPKKILVHIISSLRVGGAENMLISLVKSMPEFEHYVFYIHDGPIRHELENRGISARAIKGLISPYDPWSFYTLYKAIKKLDPCCIHTSLWAANILGYVLRKLTKIPVISVVHALCEHEGRLRTAIERCLPFAPSRYVAVSDQIAQSLVRNRRVKPASITTIYNGIDTSELSLQDSINKQNSIFVFGSVGRFVKVKNYNLLLESFAQIAHQYKHIHLMLVGNGPEEQALRLQTQALNIAEKVTFITGQKAAPYYKQFDCFVQPSRYEGLSLALLEALYFELPVIVTSPTQHHEVITHGYNGLIISPNNKKALTQSLELILTQGTLREELKSRARQTIIKNFTLQQTISNYQTLIKTLCQN